MVADPPPGAKPPATGLRRGLFLAAGVGCVGLAYLGALLPGLPTTPWVLLASWCFARSSPRLQAWLRRSPVFGALLRDWDEHRGIRRRGKRVAAVLIVCVVSASILSGRLPVWARWLVGGSAACGLCVVLFVVPTVREKPGERPA
ncbi:YbaN family protein [Urbifossiella limnaea]|uniref:Inner membrane protein YbaN n=1 Tax=Urbifossiella limnaea TaxID=2528023 RepID=A0A517XL49_9BACT|nr:YbaN family protein [Urbifossiella limnaea]QDU18233.1 Inner membrane protein YbaN [Urbifossiella limnaea]